MVLYPVLFLTVYSSFFALCVQSKCPRKGGGVGFIRSTVRLGHILKYPFLMACWERFTADK